MKLDEFLDRETGGAKASGDEACCSDCEACGQALLDAIDAKDASAVCEAVCACAAHGETCDSMGSPKSGKHAGGVILRLG